MEDAPQGAAFDPRQPSLDSLELSERFVRLLRKAVGTKADLLFGTHGQFTTPGAIRLGRELEPYNPLWYEEPIPPDNLLEFAEIAKHVHVPLATGERLTTKAEFGTLLRAGDYVMVEEPGWAVEFARLDALGMRILPVPRGPDGPDLEVMQRYCEAHQPKLFVSVSVLHNPTGYSLTPGSAHRVLQHLHRLGLGVVTRAVGTGPPVGQAVGVEHQRVAGRQRHLARGGDGLARGVQVGAYDAELEGFDAVRRGLKPSGSRSQPTASSMRTVLSRDSRNASSDSAPTTTSIANVTKVISR